MATFVNARIHKKIQNLYSEWKQEETVFFDKVAETQEMDKLVIQLDSDLEVYDLTVFLLLGYFYDLKTNSYRKYEILRLLLELCDNEEDQNGSAKVYASPINPTPVVSLSYNLKL